MSVKHFETVFGHQFSDRRLLQSALTHRSFSADHNERLEFLGDSLLNCIIAQDLFERFPAAAEGDLSRLRANLVRQDSLHRIAQRLELGAVLRLGEGELKSGGAERPSILADALEALIGAVFRDTGFERTRAVVIALYRADLEGLRLDRPLKDAKTRLQEYLQARKHALPRYELEHTQGEAHAQEFSVACRVDALRIVAHGQGPSRRAAEQVAASRVLEKLE